MGKVILDAEIPLSPPSVNTYWRANGKTRFVSEKGVKFKKDMAMYVPYVMSDKRLKAEVTFHLQQEDDPILIIFAKVS